MSPKIAQGEKKIKALNTMLTNLESKKMELMAELDDLDQSINESTGYNEELEERKNQLLAKIKETEDKIEDKQNKLNKAERELNEAERNLWDVSGKRKEMQDEVNQLIKTKNKQLDDLGEMSVRRAESKAFNYLSSAFVRQKQNISEYRESLSSEERVYFDRFQRETTDNADAHFIQEMIEEDKDEKIAVAATLFMGYVDAATTFAKTHGGGGGPSDDWGRKRNEDDLTFMGRCLIMAIQMMKPSRSARRGLKL